MCISNSYIDTGMLPCSPFIPFAGVINWTLATGDDGNRTVYVLLRDNMGNTVVQAASDSITYDGSAPVNVSVVVNGGTAATNSRMVSSRVTLGLHLEPWGYTLHFGGHSAL